MGFLDYGAGGESSYVIGFSVWYWTLFVMYWTFAALFWYHRKKDFCAVREPITTLLLSVALWAALLPSFGLDFYDPSSNRYTLSSLIQHLGTSAICNVAIFRALQLSVR